jgi:hypothetical protein
MFAEISTRQTASFHDKPAKDASHGGETNNLHGSTLETITIDKGEKETYNKTSTYVCLALSP